MAEPMDLSTAIEACRPGTADVSEPEMAVVRAALAADAQVARQFEALQQIDNTLCQLIRQGDVPASLEERILSALDDVDGTPFDSETQRASRPTKFTRRRLTSIAAIAASTAVVATGVAAWRMLVEDDHLARTEIEELATDWCDALDQAKWQTGDPPQAYPFASEVLLSPDAWQEVSLHGKAGDALAYRLPPPAAAVRRMTLLVLKANVSEVPLFPPQAPYKTQDRLVASWHVGENVYVLVIQGEDLGALQDTYQQFVKTHFLPV